MNSAARTKQVRILAVLAIFLLAFLVCIFRLVQLQLIDGEYYSRLAVSNQTRERTISAKRGVISDRNGRVLAQSDNTYMISINPNTVRALTTIKREKSGTSSSGVSESVWDKIQKLFRKLTGQKEEDNRVYEEIDRREELLKGLCEALEMDRAELDGYVAEETTYKVLKKQVPAEVADGIWDLINELDITSGVNIDEDDARLYPYGTLASQVIGFTGSDNQGLYGLEARYNTILSGTPGRSVYMADAVERDLPGGTKYYMAAENGCNVRTTIDVNIQSIIEKNLREAIEKYEIKDGGTVIVMNPNTAEILGMTSYPDYDPNDPFKMPADLTEEEWDGLSQEEQSAALISRWKSSAITDTYEPGSTFKAIVASIGLELGVVNPSTEVTCSPVTINDRTIKCWSLDHHGLEDFRHGVYNSCNPVFVRLSQVIGIDRFYKYVKAYGFYDLTNIDLPGESGSIFHRNPTEINMATASFGQRFNITPIQLITAYASIANGGYLLQPYVVSQVTDSSGSVVMSNSRKVIRQVISKETSATVLDILEGVVSEGSGGNAYVAGFRVAGKTGTSETLVEDQYIASFSAIAPADNPKICVLVVLKNPQGETYYGSKVAAPTAGRIVEEILEYMKVNRVYTDMDTVKMGSTTTIPDVVNLSVGDSQTKLAGIGMKTKVVGDSSESAVVMRQVPEEGSKMNSDSIVILYTEEGAEDKMVTVPYLTSMTIDEACNALHALGLNIEVSGRGKAEAQSIAAGEAVPMGTVIKVDFRINVSD